MSYWKDIYTYDQLNSLIKDGVITESFWVNNTSVNKLQGVKEIRIGQSGIVHFKNLTEIGDLEYIDGEFSFWGNISNLRNLKYVGGTLRYGAPIKSLGKLVEVGGDLRPTTNELEDLGDLRKVGGTADFRGMVHLKQLGTLKEVGENLNLVKALKGKYDLANVNVKGRIIYWSMAPKYYQEETLLKDKPPPAWEYVEPYAFENYLVQPNEPQKEFYEYFKKNFNLGIYVDVGGMRNYIRYFIYEKLFEYNERNNFKELANTYQILREKYPELSHDAERIEINIGRELGILKYLDTVLYHEKFFQWDVFIIETLKQNRYTPELPAQYHDETDLLTLLKIGFKSDVLTDFGKKNAEAVLVKLINNIHSIEKSEKEPFARRFFTKGHFYKIIDGNKVFVPEYYRAFFSLESEFTEKLKIHNERANGIPEQNKLNPNCFPLIVVFAIENYFNELTREAENHLRSERGLPKVGEGWINETNLFYRIKNEFYEHEVVHQGRPSWLGLQRFDIYFPNENIAIEYQGRQHYEAIDFFGGELGLLQNIENDRIKKEKCHNNNCILIEVYPDYNFDEVKNRIIESIQKREIEDK